MAFDTSKYTKNPFLKGEDLEEGERTVVTIKSAQEVSFPSGDTVPVLEFLELEQKLTLNKTRIKKLVEILGDDTDAWIGQRITLYQVDVTYQGKTMPGVAVGKAPAKKRPGEQRLDDEVDFMGERAKSKQRQPAVAVEDEDSPF